MALTPVEIRHIRLRKALFGYQVGQTDELLADVVTSFEDVWRDRADLADRIEQLEGELVRYRELEQLLRTTLISAERASQQMTDQTRRETESVLNEARAEAREIVREAMTERERLNVEVNRIRAQLEAVLATIGSDLPKEETVPGEAGPAPARPPASAVPPARPPAVAPPGAPSQSGWGEGAPVQPMQPPPQPRPSAGPGAPPQPRAAEATVAMNGVRQPVPR
jgi:cell division initiation protein